MDIDKEPWQIGVIVGRSGTGKTSIAKELFATVYISRFEYIHKSILDDFPEGLSVGDITTALCSVGFASPTDWLRSRGWELNQYSAKVKTLHFFQGL